MDFNLMCLQDQMSGAAMAMPQDPKAAFKAEWEALEITDHQWALRSIEDQLIASSQINPEPLFTKNKFE